jgi:ribosomal protein S18 acetylase RimI-like enzyme
MKHHLIFRKASIEDLKRIIELLYEDDLGATREAANNESEVDPSYIKAFTQINSDSNQYLMVVECENEIIATCHLTIMPSLTFTGSTRMQIEAVRVAERMRGQKIGEAMMQEAIRYGQSRGIGIAQLTTNKKRPKAKQFYEKLGFEATHEGMKLYLAKDTDANL